MAPRIGVDAGRIVISRPPRAVRQALCGLPGARWSAVRRAVTLPQSPIAAAAAAQLLRGTRDLEIDDAALALLRLEESHQAAAATKYTDPDPPEIPGLQGRSWRHQRLAYQFVRDRPGALLAMGMGTGKTRVAIGRIVAAGSLRRALIACPTHVVDVWGRQFAAHAPDWEGRVVPCGPAAGSVARRAAIAQEAIEQAQGRPVALVVNYDALRLQPLAAWAQTIYWDLIVADESHLLKNPRGARSWSLTTLGDNAGARLALTGTPAPYSPLDAYAQFRFLDTSVFGESFAAFRERYAVMGGYRNGEVLGWQNLADYRRRLDTITYHADRSVLDLPELVEQTRYHQIEPWNRQLYLDLAARYFGRRPDGTITAPNTLVQILRLQQLVCGTVPLDDGRADLVDRSREYMLEGLLSELDPAEPIVVFARFHQDLDTVAFVAARLRRGCLELSGRKNELEAWQDGRAPVLAVQIGAGGMGIDLTRAAYAIFYSVGYNLGEFDQARARVYRPGQTRTTHLIYLVAQDTIDEVIYAALKERRDTVAAVMASSVDR